MSNYSKFHIGYMLGCLIGLVILAIYNKYRNRR